MNPIIDSKVLIYQSWLKALNESFVKEKLEHEKKRHETHISYLKKYITEKIIEENNKYILCLYFLEDAIELALSDVLEFKNYNKGSSYNPLENSEKDNTIIRSIDEIEMYYAHKIKKGYDE